MRVARGYGLPKAAKRSLRLGSIVNPLATALATALGPVPGSLQGTVFGLALGLAALPVAVQPSLAVAQDVFDLVEVADGIYGSFVREPHSPSQYAASLIVLNDDHVLVVDSRHTPKAAQALIDEIRELTNRPVRYLVNTHWHSDHVYGNETFQEAFPGVRIIGHPATVEAMRSTGAQRLREELQSTREQTETWLRWLGAGRTDAGQVLSADDSTEVQVAVEQALDHVKQLESMRLVVPDLLVSDTLVLGSGERSVHIFHPGAAHTGGDLVVQVMPEGVLAVGDLIEDGFPYLDDGTVIGAATALMRLAAVPAEVVVGAHARLLSDRLLLDVQTHFFVELVAAVDEVIEEGGSEDTAVEEVRMVGFRERFTKGIVAREDGYAGFVERMVRQAYAERSGTG